MCWTHAGGATVHEQSRDWSAALPLKQQILSHFLCPPFLVQPKRGGEWFFSVWVAGAPSACSLPPVLDLLCSDETEWKLCRSLLSSGISLSVIMWAAAFSKFFQISHSFLFLPVVLQRSSEERNARPRPVELWWEAVLAPAGTGDAERGEGGPVWAGTAAPAAGGVPGRPPLLPQLPAGTDPCAELHLSAQLPTPGEPDAWRLGTHTSTTSVCLIFSFTYTHTHQHACACAYSWQASTEFAVSCICICITSPHEWSHMTAQIAHSTLISLTPMSNLTVCRVCLCPHWTYSVYAAKRVIRHSSTVQSQCYYTANTPKHTIISSSCLCHCVWAMFWYCVIIYKTLHKGGAAVLILCGSAWRNVQTKTFPAELWNMWNDVNQTDSAARRAEWLVLTAPDITRTHSQGIMLGINYSVLNHVPWLLFFSSQIAELFITEKNCILYYCKRGKRLTPALTSDSFTSTILSGLSVLASRLSRKLAICFCKREIPAQWRV